MVKYRPLSLAAATAYSKEAMSIIDFSPDGKTAWANFNSSTRGELSRDDKAAIFKYAYIYKKGKKGRNGNYIVQPGDRDGAFRYMKMLIGKKIVHDLNGPKRANKLIKSSVGGIVSGRVAEKSYRKEAKNEMMRRMGDRYGAGRRHASATPKKHKTKGDGYDGEGYDGEGYDGEGFSLFGNSSRPYEAARRRVAVRGSGIAGGFFDESDDEVEYVGMGFDDESDDSDEYYSD